jgi:trigger factor
VPAHTLAYTVTVKDVKAQVLPELDDDFAKEVGEGFPTFAALRERVENDIRSRREKEIDREYDQEAVQKLVENATIEFPPHLVAREVERLMHEQFIPNDDHKAFERMLRAAGVSEDRLRAGLEPAATERVKRGLVLSRLRELESLTVPDELVTAELERMIADSPQPDEYRSAFDTAYGRDLIANRLLTERILERLRLIMRGEAPELEIPPSEDAPAGEAAETPDTAEKTE